MTDTYRIQEFRKSQSTTSHLAGYSGISLFTSSLVFLSSYYTYWSSHPRFSRLDGLLVLPFLNWNEMKFETKDGNGEGGAW